MTCGGFADALAPIAVARQRLALSAAGALLAHFHQPAQRGAKLHRALSNAACCTIDLTACHQSPPLANSL